MTRGTTSDKNDPELLLVKLKTEQMEIDTKICQEELLLKKQDQEDMRIEQASKNAMTVAQTKKFEAEAMNANIMAKAQLLRQRKLLLEEGHSLKDVNACLPLN